MGFSKGTADVEFTKPEDAKKAIEKFDSKNLFNLDAEIEGTPMKVEYARSANRERSRRPLRRPRRKVSQPNEGFRLRGGLETSSGYVAEEG